MRFALLGDHADGLDMARALVESGRHEMLVYSGSPVGMEYVRRWNLSPRRLGDVEEVLADPALQAIIVAGRPADRPAQLRRALQSEHHVLCVHPAGQTPDLAYEAAMLQGDTRQVLFPLLPEALHPAIQKLAALARGLDGETKPLGSPPLPLAHPRLVHWERWASEQVLLETDTAEQKPAFPGWDVLRLLGGEIVEVMALAGPETVELDEPLLLAGRFTAGGLFQVALVPNQPEARWRLRVLTTFGQAELVFPQGWPGPACLEWQDQAVTQTKAWETWNPWPAMVEAFEFAVDANTIARFGGSKRAPVSQPWITWQDEVRCLELDDAARRSVQRRRASTLDYQEATEEAGFKGTMTLVGCSLLWVSLVLLILSVWLPWLGWVILPVFALFLGLQILRWVVPESRVQGIVARAQGPEKVSSPPGTSAPADSHITTVTEFPGLR